VSHLDDWHRVTTKNIINQGGAGLLQKYKSSKSKLFQTNYPEHNWNFNKQKNTRSSGFWKSKRNQREFMDSLGKILGIRYLDEWYNITTDKIISNNGKGLLKRYNCSIYKLLQTVYFSNGATYLS